MIGTRWSFPGAALLVALCFASYITVLVFGGWIWDDPDYVLKNPTLRDAAGLARIWTDPSATPQYYPLVFTSLFAEYQLVAPADPQSVAIPAFLFHLDNVILFALTVVGFWCVLLRLGVPGAFLGAALFAVHPVHVESVAWVTERKNMLSGLFGVLTVLAYLRFARIGDGAADRAPRWGWFAAAFGLWVCGLLSKSVLAFLPPALLLVLWWKRALRREHWITLALMMIPGVAAGLHTSYLEVTQVGASDAQFPELEGFVDRLLLAGTVVWVYLKHLLVPYPQMFFYPKWDPSPASWWQWGLLVAAVALPLVLWWKRARLGRGPLVAVLIFGGALFPVMGFHNVYPMKLSWVADHFQYHADFAMFGLLGALLCALSERVSLPRQAGVVAFSVLLAGLAGLSNLHGRAFASAETLYRQTLEHNRGVLLVWENLGIELSNKARGLEEAGRMAEALPVYEEAHRCYREALQLGRDPHLLRALSGFHLRRFMRSDDPTDLDAAERFAKEAAATFEWADVLFWRGATHRAAAITTYEAALAEVVGDTRQSAYARQKLTTPPHSGTVERLAKCYLDRGNQLLAGGDASGALEIWTRPRRPWNGPGTEALNELYAWPLGQTSRWFALELHRLWMKAAHANPEVRAPAKLLESLPSWWQGVAQPRLRGGGLGPAGLRVAEAFVFDAQAAALAHAGRFEDATLAAAEVVRRLAGQAASDWLTALRGREQSYRRREVFQFDKAIPVPPGLRQ